MKRFGVVAALGLTLLVGACGDDKVDRDGTRDLIIKQLEASGVTADKDCLDDLFDQYSDAELTKIDEQLGKNDTTGQAGEFVAKMVECITVTS